MAASLGTLRVDLIADIARFSKGLSRAEQIANKRARNIRRVIQSIGGAFAGFSAAAVVGGTVRAFADFEKGLVAVGKTADLEGKELEAFGEQIIAIGAKVPVANAALLEIAAAAAQVGVKGTANIATFTETMARLALATDVAGEEGAKSIARILKVTNTATSEVGKFGSVLVDLGNNAAASESEILEVATRVAQATGLFKVGANEALAYGAAFKSVGQQAEVVGSVLGKTFLTISQAAAQGGEDLERIASIAGMTSSEFKKLFDSSSSAAVNAFIVGLGNMEGGANAAADALDDLGLSGVRPIAVLGSMANSSAELTAAFDLMKTAADENNALFIESVKSATTFSGQMQLLGNAANSAAVNIGRLIAPAALAAIQGLSSASRTLADNVIYLKDAASIVAAVIAGKVVASLGAAAGASNLAAIATGRLSLALVLLNVRLGAAAVASRAFAVTLAFFGGPIGAAIAAVGAAFLIVSNHTKTAADATQQYSDAMDVARQAGEDAAETSKRLSKERLESARTTLLAVQAEFDLALARQEFLKTRSAPQSDLFKNAEKEAKRLRSQLSDTALGIIDLDKELDGLGNTADETSKKTGVASAKFDGLGASAVAAAQDISIMGQALDAVDAQFAALDAAEVRKITGEDDPTFDAKMRLKVAADSVDPNRELQSEIDQLTSDIKVAPNFEGVDEAKIKLGELQDEYNKNAQGMVETTDTATNEMSEFAIAAARSMQGALSDGFFSVMQGDMDNMADNFKRTIDRMVSDMLASQLLDMAVGAFSGTGAGTGGGFFSSFFKAGGGPVSADHAYMVGERGPELFVPQTAGVIHPNNQLTTGGITVNQIVNTPDVNSFKYSGRQLALDQSRLLSQAGAYN